MEPLFKWVGGKRTRLSLMHFPCFREYREPFCGSAAVFFHLEPNKSWLNDIDSNIVNVLSVAKSLPHNQALYCMLRSPVRPFESLEDQKASIEKSERFQFSKPDVEQALLFLRLIHYSHRGRPYASGYCTYNPGSPRSWNNFNGREKAKRLAYSHFLLKNAKITQGDFAPVITNPGKDVFIFIDPPYITETNSSLYRDDDRGLHARLADLLKVTPHKFLLTAEDSPEYRKLFSWATIRTEETKYDSRTKADKKVVELFITNY